MGKLYRLGVEYNGYCCDTVDMSVVFTVVLSLANLEKNFFDACLCVAKNTTKQSLRSRIALAARGCEN